MARYNNQIHNELSHHRSVERYPSIDFADDEFVVIDVRRSKIGQIYIWTAVLAVVVMLIILSQLASQNIGDMMLQLMMVGVGYLASLMIIIYGLMNSSMYRNEYMVVTNQRVFARIHVSPFAHHSQSVELERIEDISLKQEGILPMILDYGTIRLSTIGDEHTYKFAYVDDPKSQYKVISQVVNAVDDISVTKYTGQNN